jgi:gluconolactonase
MSPPITLRASLFARLPPALHYAGEPTEWVRVTRPGQRLHSFLEGPCFDATGDLWLVDVPYGRLFRIAPDGRWTLAHAYDGEPHGLARRADGTFALTDYRRGLLAFHPATQHISLLSDRINTEPFRGLSDVTVAPNGDVWFTDAGRSSLSQRNGSLLRLRAGAAKAERVLSRIPYPNGVAVGADGRFVYVAVTRANAVWRLLADAPDPGEPMVGVHLHLSGGLGPDGLARDAHGRLAVVQAQAGRADIFDAIGETLARIRVPEGSWTTSCAFSPDGSALLIVEAETGSVYRADIAHLPLRAE